MKQRDSHRTYKDPVCGMEVSIRTATDEFEYGGKVYYFCAPTCRETFKVNPKAYVREHRQHGMSVSKL